MASRRLTRIENWPTPLLRVIDKSLAQPFAWGKLDCCLFACDGIKAMTGVDPASPFFRGKYRSKTGAIRLMREFAGERAGVEEVADRITKALGMAEVDIDRVGRGDLGLMESQLGPTLGLHYGGYFYAPGPDGLARLPTFYTRRNWIV